MVTKGNCLRQISGECTNCIEWTNYNPVVTLVGGAGNTVPQYSSNKGRWQRRGNTVWVDIALSGDGGNEGAGTGQVNIELPVQAGASVNGDGVGAAGYYTNGTVQEIMGGQILAGATTIACRYWSTIKKIELLTGANQDNTTRAIYLHFWYEVDA